MKKTIQICNTVKKYVCLPCWHRELESENQFESNIALVPNIQKFTLILNCPFGYLEMFGYFHEKKHLGWREKYHFLILNILNAVLSIMIMSGNKRVLKFKVN